MLQYMSMLPITIKNKNNQPIRIKSFRKRVKYNDIDKYFDTVQDLEDLRTDLLSYRLYKSIWKVGGIIDVNDMDVFSLATGDRIKYVSPEVLP